MDDSRPPTRKPEWALKTSVQLVANRPGRSPYYRATRTIAWDHDHQRAIQVSGIGPDERSARERLQINIERRQSGTTANDLNISRKIRELTLEQYLKDWQEHLQLADTTAVHVESRMRLHVYQSDLGQMKLRAIKTDDCQLFMAQLAAKQHPKTRKPLLGPAIRRKIYYDLFNAFEEAVNSDKIQLLRNPLKSSNVKPPKSSNKPKDSEKLAEIADKYRFRIFSALKDDKDNARWTVALLGLRQGEALGLTVENILETRKGTKLIITHALKRRENRHGCGDPIGNKFPCGKQRSTGCPNVIPGAYYLGSPKTPTSARTIPLTGFYEKALLDRKHAVEQILANPPKTWKPDGGLETLLFQRLEDGRPRGSHQDADAWHAFLKANNIEDFRGHGTRHITVSILASIGFDAETIQKITGWSNATMMAVYNHQIIETLREPITQLSDRFAEHDFENPVVPTAEQMEEWSG